MPGDEEHPRAKRSPSQLDTEDKYRIRPHLSFCRTNRSQPGNRCSRSMDVPSNDQQPNCVDHNTAKARSDCLMKWFTAMLLAVMFSPLASATQHDEWALMAHGERRKDAYLVLRTITQEIELIPVESLNQREKIGSEIMKCEKLSKFLNGYKCIPGLL